MKKKSLAVLTASFLLVSMLSSCSSTPATIEVTDEEITLTITSWNDDKTKTETLERTGKYTGTLTDGLPNGTGKFESTNSDGATWYYDGEFVDGQFHGQGSCVWPESGYSERGTYEKGFFTPNDTEFIAYCAENGAAKWKLSDNTREFISTHDEIFPATESKAIEYVIENTESLEYKEIMKSFTKYDQSLYHSEEMVIQITEINVFNRTATYLLTTDGVNFCWLIYNGALPDVYNNDTIEFYAIPAGLSSFTNVGGGLTNVVVSIGSVIERIG